MSRRRHHWLVQTFTKRALRKGIFVDRHQEQFLLIATFWLGCGRARADKGMCDLRLCHAVTGRSRLN